jgi:hypothetical protein
MHKKNQQISHPRIQKRNRRRHDSGKDLGKARIKARSMRAEPARRGEATMLREANHDNANNNFKKIHSSVKRALPNNHRQRDDNIADKLINNIIKWRMRSNDGVRNISSKYYDGANNDNKEEDDSSGNYSSSGGEEEEEEEEEDGDDNAMVVDNKKKNRRKRKQKHRNSGDDDDDDEWENDKLPIDKGTELLFLNNKNQTTQEPTKKISNQPSCMSSLANDDTDETTPSSGSEFLNKQAWCFACSHIGDNSPTIKGSILEDLMIAMGTGLRTTNLPHHCINISEQYEETIRKPINNKILRRLQQLQQQQHNSSSSSSFPEEEKKLYSSLLPEWPPIMVKEHLELHHNDPELTVELMMHRLKHSICFIWKESLILKKKTRCDNNDDDDDDDGANDDNNGNEQLLSATADSICSPTEDNDESYNNNDNNNNNNNNPPLNYLPNSVLIAEEERSSQIDEMTDQEQIPLKKRRRRRRVIKQPDVQKKIDMEQWKILNGMIMLYLKLGKSRPDTMIPFYSKGRYIVEERAQHPFFDTANKNIYKQTSKDQQTIATTTTTTTIGKPTNFSY